MTENDTARQRPEAPPAPSLSNDRLTRRETMRRAAVLGLGAAAAAAMLRPAGGVAAQEPIKIGQPYNLTGDYASIDNPARDGSALAAAEVNAAGGVLGKPLELIVADGKSDVPTIASVTKKLVDEDKVVALVGLTDTSYMRAAGPVAQEAHLPFLDVGGTAPVITTIGDYIFMLPFGDNVQAAAGAEFDDVFSDCPRPIGVVNQQYGIAASAQGSQRLVHRARLGVLETGTGLVYDVNETTER